MIKIKQIACGTGSQMPGVLTSNIYGLSEKGKLYYWGRITPNDGDKSKAVFGWIEMVDDINNLWITH